MAQLPKCNQLTDIKLSEIFARAAHINLQRILREASLENALHHEVGTFERQVGYKKFTRASVEHQPDILHDRNMHKQSMCNSKQPMSITLADLQTAYHLPISSAARMFDIGLTLLKKRCRELGLKRWPYRKLKSMDKLLNSIESIHGSDPQVVRAANEVRTHKQQMVMDPSKIHIEVGIKRCRQAAYKFQFKSKRLG